MTGSDGPPIFFSERFLDHEQLPGHPECPERLAAIRARLEAEGLWTDIRQPEPLDPEQVEGVHTPGYLARLKVAAPTPYDGDTLLRPETFEIALLAAGAVVQAALATAEKPGRPTLALPRPPGHHAGPDYGGGFCYLNNVALAARALQRRGLKRVAIVDLDVHHGNGAAEIFAADSTVLYCSLHGWPLYPGTGAATEAGLGRGEGFTVNIPLPAGSGDATYLAAMERVLLPVLTEFAPEALLISLGGDAHWADPLAPLALSSAGYAACLEGLVKLVRRRSLPLAVALEGGYHLEATAEVVACAAALLAGRELPKLKFGQVRDETGAGLAAVERARETQARYWI